MGGGRVLLEVGELRAGDGPVRSARARGGRDRHARIAVLAGPTGARAGGRTGPARAGTKGGSKVTANEKTPARGFVARALDLLERVGNRLPEPATIFVLLALLVLVASVVAAQLGLQ